MLPPVTGGKLQGNTQYVVTVISEATDGDLFEIKNIHTYPDSRAYRCSEKGIGRQRPCLRLTTHIKK